MNKNAVALTAMFLLGAFAGSGFTYIFTRNEIKKINQEKEEEISSVRETYTNMQKELAEKNRLEKSRIMDDYLNGVASFGYVDEVFNNDETIKKNAEFTKREDDDIDENLKLLSEKDILMNKKPEKESSIYLITSEQYGENEEYDAQDLTYYSNDIVTDAFGEIVDNPSNLLGETVMSLLPEYDSQGFTETYVRNEDLLVDFEVDFAGTDYEE